MLAVLSVQHAANECVYSTSRKNTEIGCHDHVRNAQLRLDIVDTAGNTHRELIYLPVVQLTKHDVFLGWDWLHRHNPNIDWHAAKLLLEQCPYECNMRRVAMDKSDDQECHRVDWQKGETVIEVNFANHPAFQSGRLKERNFAEQLDYWQFFLALQ